MVWSFVSVGAVVGLALYPLQLGYWVFLAIALWGVALYYPFPVTARIRQSVTIDRPAGQVFEFLARPANQPLWNPRVGACQPADVPPEVGQEWTFASKRRWRKQSRMMHRFSRLEPPRLVEITAAGRGMSVVSAYIVEDMGEQSRVLLDATVDGLPAVAACASSAIGWIYRSPDFRCLKRILEGAPL
ncbi:MAG: Polyketide cyclase / dehydrase and lipid transport [Chloroflexota bacterium]|nr:Polyketide cyclase / dehydrase and lipid transport [Chloroflexota bacterium]